MLDNDNDTISLPMSTTDFRWLVSQLEQWPTRIDPEKTTNIQFLMKNAANVIKTFLMGDRDMVINSSSDPVNDSREELLIINGFFQELAGSAKQLVKEGQKESIVWDNVLRQIKQAYPGDRINHLITTVGITFDYYDPGTSERDDAMAFISAFDLYTKRL